MKIINDIKNLSKLGIISFILTITIAIILIIEAIMVLIMFILPMINSSIGFVMPFDFTFLSLIFLSVITIIFGIIARVAKKERFGSWAIVIGILSFILNWIFLIIAIFRIEPCCY